MAAKSFGLRCLGVSTLAAGVLASALGGCTDEQPDVDAGSVPPCATGAICTVPPDGGPIAPAWDAGRGDGAVLGQPGNAAQPKPDDLPCDVKAILATHCSACHKASGSAPLALESAADFRVSSKKEPARNVLATAAERLTTGVNTQMMPPAGLPRLSAEELATLQAWLTASAPARTGASCAVSPTPTPTPMPVPEGAKCFRMLAHDGGSKDKKFKVGRADNAYNDTRYAISMRPVIDNAKVIHHWLLFQEDGIDGAVVPATGAHPAGQLLTGWAPGGDGVDLIGNPDDVGYEMPGQVYTIEFHYVSDDPNAEDASGVEICMMDHKPKNIAALSWVGKDQLGVPTDHWVGQCRPASSEPIHIVGVTPHMHIAGNRMRGVINRKDGKQEVLHDEPFDFDYQRSYKKDVVLQPGESITTDCWYNSWKAFGERTDEEMCYLFTYAYPKGALSDPFSVWGGVAHGSSACLSE